MDCAPSSGTFTIQSADDVTFLNQCAIFTGNVTVAAKELEDITLNGLKTVTGTLQIIDVENVSSISSTTLQSASAIILKNLPKLSTLALPALTNFSRLDFTDLTALKSCDIAAGALIQDVNEINVLHTGLEKLDWLRWPVASQLTVAANGNLKEFKLPYNQINAGSTYQISINSVLSNLDFSQLSGIYGSLTVNGNSDTNLNFDKLETIDGYVRLQGPLKNLTMPVLNGINGALRAESTADILSFCNWLSTQNQLLGHYDCTANNTNPVVSSTATKSPVNTAGPTSSTVATGGNEDSKSGISTGGIVGIAVAMVVAMSLVLTATALLFFRRRARNKARAVATAVAISEQHKKTHSTSTLGEELDASGVRYELGGEKDEHELPGVDAVRELDSQSFQELDGGKPFFRDQKPATASPIGRFELP
ncbi:cell wall protein Ecm33 [Neodidymelliopsis sp. IMI 364377]|nr:cell wall protein Ecm33 [Neodidymelliopsis sp. IMI 364377]